MKIQCTSCQAKFTGPDSLAGRRVNCPKCGQAIAVPTAQAAARNSGSAPSDLAPLGSLLDSELPREAELPAEPLANAALQIRRKRKLGGSRGLGLFSRLGSMGESDEGHNPFVQFLLEHKLVLGTFLVGGFWILLDVLKLDSGFIALVGCVGIFWGAGAWRLQAVGNTTAGENWVWLDVWIGRFLMGVPIVFLGFGCCQLWYHYFEKDWFILTRNGREVMSFDITVQATVILGIYIAVFVGIAVAAERFGFFRMASAAFVSIFGVLPIVLMLFGPAIIRHIDLRQALRPAQPNMPVANRAVADQNTGAPPVVPTFPRLTIPVNPGPGASPILNSSPDRPLSRPSSPATSADIAELASVWNFEPDPSRTPITPVSDSLGIIPKFPSSAILFPNVVSPLSRPRETQFSSRRAICGI